MRVGLVVPHIFFHKDILPDVIFAPGTLAIGLAEGLKEKGVDVTLFSAGPIDTRVKNISADLSFFENELALRNDNYLDLLRKHPLVFVSLARQAQAEIIAKAFEMANNDELDVVHIYTNEEDIALPFASLCMKPVVFTHHDPFSFLIKYKNLFPRYKNLNWISMSLAQRRDMPKDTNWVGNIYHGIDKYSFKQKFNVKHEYVAYIGRIVESKGVHLAIAAVKSYNKQNPDKPLKLKIAGKHYSGHGKDDYWQTKILPEIDDNTIEYVGFVKGNTRQDFLANALALLVPSVFEEPFGIVTIEALACGTPVIGLDSGAIGEIVKDGQTGFLVKKSDEKTTINNLSKALKKISLIDRHNCRQDFEARFTLDRMCAEHIDVYKKLSKE